MCVDFTNHNKAYPKDINTLPSIDELIDGASGNEILAMRDVHSNYNHF